MPIGASDDLIAESIASVLVEGFNKHYRLFHESSALAKQRFEEARWQEGQQAVRDRIPFYDDRVNETTARLRGEFNADSLSDAVWQHAKLHYIGLLTNHKQPELAETFFNSVCCRILHRTYFHNDFIFVRPAVSTEYIESDPSTYRCYYPNEAGFHASIRQVFVDFGWARTFDDLDRDVDFILRSIESHLGGTIPAREANLQIQVLNAAFYRNKGASARRSMAPLSIRLLSRYCIRRKARSILTLSFSTPGGSLFCFPCRALISWSTWKCLPAMSSFCARSRPASRAPSFTPCSGWASRARPCFSAT